ncbi:putative CDP-diacylglycerol inositol 3-phosphatidyltransferase [Pseudorhizobium banfieldiae]|uniref:Putative CDP-diacylglycerol inositol 3-phosphatidyltransferase n=1 Tax=Pseudorhizobium banfieldiae TaxID=1125847 RepID=L0NBQ7_9HYPH|nr:CDP-alcohol phosphatidyltransferase family protein [Pseudorhizobium banfieldiae]CAD6601905.1 CDP-alcohol phosphatidyltransferase family protein [arsenite-oxidising bacterium NT-25]CCF18314.1 putative CDP-diacylglycerol inositol 3-phosphatidyltransferase [Pseudorhizobium banfieldiae]
MFDAFQRLIMADAATTRFLIIFIGFMTAIYAANAVYVLVGPKPEPKKSRGESPGPSTIQRTAKTAISRFAGWVASQSITPNQITLVGLVLVFMNCALFAYHKNTFLFGTSLIVAYLFDTLDGVVARAQGTSTRFGGYLDAVVDRYQEIATYLVIGWVLDQWLVAFLVITGSMLTSYNKARAAIEIPVDNKGWPDLLAKPARLFFLCLALIGDANLPWLLPGMLWALAFMTHFTALQRIIRAYLLIRQAETLGSLEREG